MDSGNGAIACATSAIVMAGYQRCHAAHSTNVV